MSLANAAAYLLVTSLKNRVGKQVRRLRQPRYLAATALGGAYLWVVFVRPIEPNGQVAYNPMATASIILAMGVLSVAGSWIFGGEEGALVFSEAEATLLFSAPVTRAALIRYKVARTLLVAVLSALLMTIFAGRRLGAHPLYFSLGAWIGLSTLSLHLTAASLTRATLVRFGLSGLRRRLVTVAAMAVAVGLLLYWAVAVVHPPTPTRLDLGAWGDYLTALMGGAPLSWVLWPLRAPMNVAFAQRLPDLWPALPIALALLGVHVAWVLSSDVAFEGASLAAAARRSERSQARGRGRTILTVRRSAPPFALSAEGRPWVAIGWKNLTSLTRVVSVRLVLWVVLLGLIFVSLWLGTEDRAQNLALGLLALAAFTVVFAPQLVSSDIREDLPHLEILRTWPLSGRQVAMGELMAPSIVLTAALGAQILGATALSVVGDVLPWGPALALGLSAMLIAPPLAVAGLAVQNLAAILLPSWVGEDNQRGVEAIGQRLLTMIGRILVLTLGVLPAALLGGGLGGLLYAAVGEPGLVVGAALAAVVLGVELWLLVGLIGRTFERADLSRE